MKILQQLIAQQVLGSIRRQILKHFQIFHVINSKGLQAVVLSCWTFSFHVLPAFHPGLSVVSALLPRGRVYYTVGTIAHNGPLFWLDAVERSLVKHISSPIMSHPAISIPFYQLSLPPCLLCSLFARPLTLSCLSHLLFSALTLHAESVFIFHQG